MELTERFRHLKLLTRLGNSLQQLARASSSCCLCGSACQQFSLLCDVCYHDLPHFYYAQLAGDLLNWPAIYQHINHQSFDHLVCLSPYIWPVNQWISALKFQRKFELASLLGQLLYQLFQSNELVSYLTNDAVIIPVPIHIKRWQQRGYNQAHLIAQAFAQQSKIPLQSNLLIKAVNQSSQVGKSGSARRRNNLTSFQLNPHATVPKHILLVDDVLTTGTTVNNIATLLKRQGVRSITVITAAITLPKLGK